MFRSFFVRATPGSPHPCSRFLALIVSLFSVAETLGTNVTVKPTRLMLQTAGYDGLEIRVGRQWLQVLVNLHPYEISIAAIDGEL